MAWVVGGGAGGFNTLSPFVKTDPNRTDVAQRWPLTDPVWNFSLHVRVHDNITNFFKRTFLLTHTMCVDDFFKNKRHREEFFLQTNETWVAISWISFCFSIQYVQCFKCNFDIIWHSIRPSVLRFCASKWWYERTNDKPTQEVCLPISPTAALTASPALPPFPLPPPPPSLAWHFILPLAIARAFTKNTEKKGMLMVM